MDVEEATEVTNEETSNRKIIPLRNLACLAPIVFFWPVITLIIERTRT